MSSLYTRYRPKDFSGVVGQSHITKLLKAELKKNLAGHAYLFIGPRGTGKTTTARILAKALNCTALHEGEPCGSCAMCVAFDQGKFLDLIEIDAASNRGIDEMREIKEKIEYNPTMGSKKIYIIDEVHMLTKEAFNALLKTLEEPPAYVTFILATTEPHKIPATILSRCEKYEFRLGGTKELKQTLSSIMESENIQVDKKGIELLITHAGGSYRDAVSLLDTIVAATGDKELSFDEVRIALGLPDSELVNSYVVALAEKSLEVALAALHEVFIRGTNIAQFTKSVILLVRDVMMERELGDEIGPILRSVSSARYTEIIKVLLEAYTSQKYSFDQRLPLQLATIQLIPEGEIGTPLRKSEPVKQKNETAKITEMQAGIQESKKSEAVTSEERIPTGEKGKTKKATVKKKKKVSHRIDAKPIPFETVVDLWPQFTQEVQKEQRHLYTFLVPAVPCGVQFDSQLQVVKIEIKVPFDFHKKQLENAKHQQLLGKAALKIYGSPVQFICILSKEQIVFKKQVVHDSSKSPLLSEGSVVGTSVEADPIASLESAFDSVLGGDVEMLG